MKYYKYEDVPKETRIYTIFFNDDMESQISYPVLGKFVKQEDYLSNPFSCREYKFKCLKENEHYNYTFHYGHELYADTKAEAIELRNEIIKTRIYKLINIANGKGEEE